jgi:hypothetical protein
MSNLLHRSWRLWLLYVPIAPHITYMNTCMDGCKDAYTSLLHTTSCRDLSSVECRVHSPNSHRPIPYAHTYMHTYIHTYIHIHMQALRSKISVITGGPGVGKTTVLNMLTRMLEEEKGLCVVLAAPTGRAARRMTDCTAHPATTIHRLINARIGWCKQFDISINSVTMTTSLL